MNKREEIFKEAELYINSVNTLSDAVGIMKQYEAKYETFKGLYFWMSEGDLLKDNDEFFKIALIYNMAQNKVISMIKEEK